MEAFPQSSLRNALVVDSVLPSILTLKDEWLFVLNLVNEGYISRLHCCLLSVLFDAGLEVVFIMQVTYLSHLDVGPYVLMEKKKMEGVGQKDKREKTNRLVQMVVNLSDLRQDTKCATFCLIEQSHFNDRLSLVGERWGAGRNIVKDIGQSF